MPKLTLKNLTLPKLSKPAIVGLSVLALATVGGTAYAAQSLGGMTRAEVQTKSGEHFTKLDVNQDGKLDAADRTAKQAAKFDALDANKDGAVSRDEFATARAGQGPDGQRMGRGERGGKHAGHGGRRGGMHGGKGGGMMLGLADTNKDGAVSKAEFTAAALARFDKADTNKDGTVTRDEHHAARAAMRPAAAPAPVPAT